MIELVIVTVIVLALMGIAMLAFRGARTSTDNTIVKTAAQSYAEVIDSFALDHAGRVPVYGNETDWPTNAIDRGPVKPSPTVGAATGTNTYLGRSVPEAVTGTSVDWVTSVTPNGTPPATGTRGVLRYVTAPITAPATVATSYRIEVWAATAEKKLPASMTCWLGTYAPPKVDGKDVPQCA